MPTISVVVPVYNVENYIRSCIESILVQTLTDYELILIDDGSTDCSGIICDTYHEMDPRITVVHQENKGVSAARNAGLDLATGKYVMFCDSDDMVAPTWCERMYDTICRNEDAFIVCNCIRINDAENPQKQQSTVSVTEVSYYDLYNKGLSGYSCNKIFRKEILDKIGLRFPVDLKYAEDVVFTTKYCMECSTILLISDTLYYYRQTSGSTLHQFYPNLFTLLIPAFKSRLPLLEKEIIPEYCDIYYYEFYHALENVFDSRNKTMSLFDKFRYNQMCIRTEEFQFCLANASLQHESPIITKLLKAKNYYLVWAFQKAVQIKRKLIKNSE